MLVNFTKMHGLGNDFIIVDQIKQRVKFNLSQIKRIADRKFGVGCDQVLLIEPPSDPEAVCFVRIYNQNGQEASQCGNGMRCVAKFLFDTGLTNKESFKIQCHAGIFEVSIHDQLVSIQLDDLQLNIKKNNIVLDNNEKLTVYSVNLGNNHIVYQVSDLSSVDVKTLGNEISINKKFPYGVNVGFMQIVKKDRISLRVYEYGVGKTLSCGSGACAAVVVGNYLGFLNKNVTVDFAYGFLTIKYNKERNTIAMRGPTASVFLGTFRI